MSIHDMVLTVGSTKFIYKVIRNYQNRYNILVLIDLDKGMSITNNAEDVVSEVCKLVIDSSKKTFIIYRDTEGVYDELEADNYIFSGFNLLGCNNEQEAIKKSISRWEKKLIIY